MLTALCVTLLVYSVLGRDIRALARRVQDVDWSAHTARLLATLRPWAEKAGRAAARPLLLFYYVMTDERTSALDRALIYAAIVYTVSPVSLVPAAVYRLLGLMDEGAAVLYVYRKIRSRITPDIETRADDTLSEWFGTPYTVVETCPLATVE